MSVREIFRSKITLSTICLATYDFFNWQKDLIGGSAIWQTEALNWAFWIWNHTLGTPLPSAYNICMAFTVIMPHLLYLTWIIPEVKIIAHARKRRRAH